MSNKVNSTRSAYILSHSVHQHVFGILAKNRWQKNTGYVFSRTEKTTSTFLYRKRFSITPPQSSRQQLSACTSFSPKYPAQLQPIRTCHFWLDFVFLNELIFETCDITLEWFWFKLHTYNSRHTSRVAILCDKSSQIRKFVSFNAPHLWNALPSHSMSQFKRLI